MRIFCILLILFIYINNNLDAQDFRLGFGFGGSLYGEKTTPDTYTDGKNSSEFSLSLPRIFAQYSFNDRFAAELRLEAELGLEALQGGIIGMLGRYYPHEHLFLQGGLLMHKTSGDAHGLVSHIENTMFQPAIGLGYQPEKSFFIDAMFVYGGNYVITHSTPMPPYGNPHDWKVDWIFKVGAGISFSL